MPSDPSTLDSPPMKYALTIVLATSFTGCQTQVSRAEVSALMDIQREAWNQGDLREFVSYYDPSMTFCGASGVTRGIDNLLSRYEKKYPTAELRGRLTFELLDVRPLSANSALVLGKYALERKQPSSGFFSLIVSRGAHGLRILHDHTSDAAPVNGPHEPATPPGLSGFGTH